MRKSSILLAHIAVGIVLFLTFMFNLFHTVPLDRFLAFQADSQALVVGRLAFAEQHGVLSRSGLMGFAHPIPEKVDKNAYQYHIYTENLEVNDFEPYNSHPGLQSVAYSGLLHFIPVRGWNAIVLLQCLVAIIGALVFLYWLSWVYREWGLEVGLMTLLLLLCSSYVVMFARNLYWLLGVMYLPFLAALWWGEQNSRKEHSLLHLFVVMCIAALFKGLFTGFEYVSTTCLMGLLPIVYYGIRDRWSKRLFLSRLTMAAFAIGVAKVITAGTLIAQLIPEKGSFKGAAAYLWYSFGKRSYGEVTDYTFDAQAENSLRSSLYEVLSYYLKIPVIDLSHLFTNDCMKSVAVVPLYYFVLLLALITLFYYYRHRTGKGNSACAAVVISAWLSIIPPLSWLILFKGHSYVHTHMNGIVWSMPFLLWVIAAMGSMMNEEKETKNTL